MGAFLRDFLISINQQQKKEGKKDLTGFIANRETKWLTRQLMSTGRWNRLKKSSKGRRCHALKFWKQSYKLLELKIVMVSGLNSSKR